jgi:hypothetical protein
MSQVTVSDVTDIDKISDELLDYWIKCQRTAIVIHSNDRYINAILDDFMQLVGEKTIRIFKKELKKQLKEYGKNTP